jgi:3-hydroxymyristoyl/3-hydroxydecanoyl-(acyl carrier protein) dehydratase
MLSSIEVPADHPAFAGHFPAFPVLPGAVLLDKILQIIQRDRRIDLTHWQIASAKFLDAVRPGDVLRLEHDAPKSSLIRFTVRAANRTVASGILSNAPRPDGAP